MTGPAGAPLPDAWRSIESDDIAIPRAAIDAAGRAARVAPVIVATRDASAKVAHDATTIMP